VESVLGTSVTVAQVITGFSGTVVSLRIIAMMPRSPRWIALDATSVNVIEILGIPLI
jgi:multisubunit Na+/H+ antiporter MnhF subunit